LQIQQQAAVITYSETFYALALAMLLCVPLALLLKTPKPGAPVADAGH
jgi:DHA2 family multidrug resistance protein